MTIILFLIDTSASMNQRTYFGTTLLDVAKGAVETFLKFRSRDPASRGDRYMLLTFEDPPYNIKAGWKESHTTFMNELKNLQATGLTTLGPALKQAFNVLNINRMQTGIDMFGQGRCPFYLEPAIIITMTDGNRLTSTVGVHEELVLHGNSVPGAEFTKEPFRWDQRLFALVLRYPGAITSEPNVTAMVPSDNSPIDAMCEVTGGRSYMVTSQRTLNQCLESLVQKVHVGVVINFEKIGPDPPPISNENNKSLDGRKSPLELDVDENSKPGDVINKESTDKTDQNTDPNALPVIPPPVLSRPVSPSPVSNTAWYSCRKLIYVHRSAQKGYSVGHWPIPEAFWLDINSPQLPQRTAHPIVKFSCASCEPMVIDNLPFDKYELEPSPLTQHILERKQPTTCWQVFISNSFRSSDVLHPFGYLKASMSLTCVNLFVMPYNYPILLPLLDEYFKVHKQKPPRDWWNQFESYLKNIPLYYTGPLKRALQRMGAPNIIPDTLDTCMSYTVLNRVKQLKNEAKIEYDRLVSSVGQRLPVQEGMKVISRTSAKQKDLNALLQRLTGESPNVYKDIQEYSGFTLAVPDKEVKIQSYRNPFDIPRKTLLDQIARMRANFLQASASQTRLQDEDQIHSIPVGQMGNYQDYLKRMPPALREIESTPVRQHMFGNPFKYDKKMMVDEADIDIGGSPSRSKRPSELSGSPFYKKVKGALGKDGQYRRNLTSLAPGQQSPMKRMTLLPPKNKTSPVNETPPVEIKKPLIVINDVAVNEKPVDNNFIETNHIENTRVPASEEMNHIEEVPVNNNNNNNNINNNNKEIIIKNDGLVTKQLKDEEVILENIKLRTVIYKEVRKPGRNFDALFNKLNTIQGPLDIRLLFVQDIIKEANRFKRKALVSLLEHFQSSMISLEQGRNCAGDNKSIIR